MKRSIILLIILVANIVAGNAQFFVEWDAKVSFREYEVTEYNNLYTQFAIDISPKAGYWLTDHFALGSSVSYYKCKTKFEIKNPDLAGVSEDIRSEYGFSIFSRYKINLSKRFSLLLESSIGVKRNIQKEKGKKDSILKKVGTANIVDVLIFPAFSYDLSDRFTFIASCGDAMNFGMHFSKTKDEDTGQKRKNNVIGFNTQSTIFSSISNIKLGFIYNF